MVNLKRKNIFIIMMLILATLFIGYAIAADNEEENEVEKVINIFYEGYETKDLDLMMSVLSPNFLLFRSNKADNNTDTSEENDQKKKKWVNYNQFKEDNIRMFENMDVLEVNVEITAIGIENNKAKAEINFKAKEEKTTDFQESERSRKSVISLDKEKDKWVITEIENK